RIEAITSASAEQYVSRELETLAAVRESLKSPKDVAKAVESLLAEKQQLQKEIEKLYTEKAQLIKNEMLSGFVEENGISKLIIKQQFPDADSLKKISFELKNERDNLLLVVAADVQNKPMISVMISENLVETLGLHAGKLVKELGREIKGGGGGQPFYATAGGKDITGLDNVVKKAEEILGELTEKS
ncbi:MAG: DHHA1 domain-containing protein, partial [Bacteroidota bacterium]